MEVLPYWDEEEGEIGIAVRLDGLWVWDTDPQTREQPIPTLRAYKLLSWRDRFRDSALDRAITRLRAVGLINVQEQVELELTAQSLHNQMTLERLNAKRKKSNIWTRVIEKLTGESDAIKEYLKEIEKEDRPW